MIVCLSIRTQNRQIIDGYGIENLFPLSSLETRRKAIYTVIWTTKMAENKNSRLSASVDMQPFTALAHNAMLNKKWMFVALILPICLARSAVSGAHVYTFISFILFFRWKKINKNICYGFVWASRVWVTRITWIRTANGQSHICQKPTAYILHGKLTFAQRKYRSAASSASL